MDENYDNKGNEFQEQDQNVPYGGGPAEPVKPADPAEPAGPSGQQAPAEDPDAMPEYNIYGTGSSGGSQSGYSYGSYGAQTPPPPPRGYGSAPVPPPAGGGYAPAPGPEEPQKKKKSSGAKIFIAIIVVILVFAGVIVAYLFRSGDGAARRGEEKPGTEMTTASGSESAKGNIDTSGAGALDVVEAADPAANMNEIYEVASKFNVGILVYQNDKLYTEGSGIIAEQDESGKYTYIITCAHVINYSGAEFTVLMEDGTEYQAEVVGKDVRTDIGVVRIEAKGLSAASFADSSKLVVGQQVFAIGNPGGSEFFGSFTNGIISAIDRPISSASGYENDCIQHSAAINPGNSGGALVNSAGQVVGVNSAKIADTEYEGMGFAIPSNLVMKIYGELVAKGYVSRAKLGIKYTTPAKYSQQYSMYVQIQKLPAGSIVIAEIDSDSELAKADVKVGDLIVGVNGKELTDTGMLAKEIENMKIGEELRLDIVRIDSRTWTHENFTVSVKLVEDTGVTEEETTTQAYSQDDLEEYFRQFFGGNYGGFGFGSGR